VRAGRLCRRAPITLSKYATYTLSASSADARPNATAWAASSASPGSVALGCSTCAPYFLAICSRDAMVTSTGLWVRTARHSPSSLSSTCSKSQYALSPIEVIPLPPPAEQRGLFSELEKASNHFSSVALALARVVSRLRTLSGSSIAAQSAASSSSPSTRRCTTTASRSRLNISENRRLTRRCLAPGQHPGALQRLWREKRDATLGFGGCRRRPRIEGASAHASPRSRLCAANKGHDTRGIQGWLGRRSITSTAFYTALTPNRFKDSGETELPRDRNRHD
jgi:hypothetical protein